MDITSEQSVRELAILEYEKNLAKYQNSYSFEQAEQRYNSYKRALVDAYKQRLLEVERLCDEELENIRRNANCLQPFKEIASQWSVDENDRGDSQRVCNDQSKDTEQSKIAGTSNDFSNDWRVYGKVDNEVNMVPEILCARFHREETT
ncbi:structural maintenance of chromosomes protein 3-like isoform x2 protein [Lasius niger]|uniref:Structural maintenance of chromosomes protein 3-like isoform x2 protein n=2 Tax=Lasius TaxID=488720 RepID=A0A0J7KSP3_LASNI|nr:structural maintenance of chromosomes protein 3-like isoform x2 protein [Lasius niger]